MKKSLPMHMCSGRSPLVMHRQRGLSLLELMVGIVIGLLVVLAAVASLVFTRVSSQTVGDSSRLQQDASTAFRIIGHHIRQGGARRVVEPIAGSSNVLFNGLYQGYGVNPNTGSAAIVNGSDGTGTNPDVLQVSHDSENDLGTTDCLGELPVTAATDNIQNRFFYVLNGQGVGELRCLGSGATSAATPAGFALVQGVEDFQVWYGFRALGTDDVRYRTAGQLAVFSPVPWDQVESVMVCLRMSSERSNYQGVATTGCQNEAIPADGRVRRVFFRVFNIRNVGV